jgi:hypothetical protein
MLVRPHLVVVVGHAFSRVRVFVLAVHGTHPVERHVRPRLFIISVIFFSYCYPLMRRIRMHPEMIWSLSTIHVVLIYNMENILDIPQVISLYDFIETGIVIQLSSTHRTRIMLPGPF